MKKYFAIGLMIICVLSACNKKRVGNTSTPPKKPAKTSPKPHTTEKPEVQYSHQYLETYLDSIGHLPAGPLVRKSTQPVDSFFWSYTKPMNKVLSQNDYIVLKKAIRKGMISVGTVKKIFGELLVDSACDAKGVLDTVEKGSVDLQYFRFGKNRKGLEEFALRVGDTRRCIGSEVYYFQGNRIIAKQDGYAHYSDNIDHYTADDGEAMVYRIYEFDDGSGIWWNNYFFYKYDNGKLIPVLNVLQNGNMQEAWGPRVLWLESTILKPHPLKIKMVYYWNFYKDKDNDKEGFDESPMFVNDSTIVNYKWDEASKTLKGQFERSKIIEPQVLTYYLIDNEELFINAYYPVLKQSLRNKKLSTWTFAYLNKIKNHN
jgi:hypothetical protein